VGRNIHPEVIDNGSIGGKMELKAVIPACTSGGFNSHGDGIKIMLI